MIGLAELPVACDRRVFRVADLFCGAGGSSTGAFRAIQALGGTMDLIAINHWDTAIATHSKNHPTARHYCVELDAARPEEIVTGGHLDLLMASPECVFFSRARGGKPMSDQRRMSAWHVQRWASAIDITCILVENVPEFQFWGPLLPHGRPDPTKRGVYFQAWIQSLWAMGYVVDWKLINAADYGDATTRTRFFLQARKDGRPITWPAATHSPTGSKDLFGRQKRWRAAREVIDWTNPGRSILGRKKPLSEKTRRRIARGLTRFGGTLASLYIRLLDLEDAPARSDAVGEPSPFIVANRGNATPKPIEDPVPTITTLRGWNVGVVEPVIQPFVLANRNNNVPKSITDPVPTATTSTGGGVALVEPTCEPFVLGQQSGSVARSTTDPVPTIATDGAISLVEPIIAPYYGNGTPRSVDEPLGTVTTKDRFGLCSPVVVPFGPRCEARDVGDPLPTILTKDRLGLATPSAEPFIGWLRWGSPTDSVDNPLRTITSEREGYLVEPFLVPQFGEAPGQVPRVHDVDDPLPAVTSHGAGALVSPTLETPTGTIDPRRLVRINGEPHVLDIRFRMLTNKELARAMGFDQGDAEYDFAGTVEDVTKQIGNAVAVGTAQALVTAILGELG